MKIGLSELIDVVKVIVVHVATNNFNNGNVSITIVGEHGDVLASRTSTNSCYEHMLNDCFKELDVWFQDLETTERSIINKDRGNGVYYYEHNIAVYAYVNG